ncbi:YybH family protein [Anatilimnocola floriformis]|uniref:YybH family protein n=1 Tax=Anatilimnocola floriformis TaxID=2948575 RepID=UPI0020C4FB8C|nr:nuclear transport factor 2 family protein [Anatilimnocola floriformis]
MLRFIVMLGLFCLTLSAAKAAETKPSAEETAVRKVLNDQVAAWNKGDLDGFMAGYWNSEELTFYSGKDKQLGWAKTLERYQKRYQSDGKEMGQLAFAELEVQTLSPEYAIVKGRFKVELKKETLEGLFTLVMKKMDRGWVIVHDHTSS